MDDTAEKVRTMLAAGCMAAWMRRSVRLYRRGCVTWNPIWPFFSVAAACQVLYRSPPMDDRAAFSQSVKTFVNCTLEYASSFLIVSALPSTKCSR